MNTPLLIVFLGFPGSGKTYFSVQLAKKLNAVTLNSDALRLSMFGSQEQIEKIRNRQRSRLYADVFGAMDYAARQILKAGHTVIYDAQQTKRSDRLGIEKLAAEVGATPVLIWIKTSPEVALQRGQYREAREDSHQYSAEKMTMLIERFYRVTDLPSSDENVIEINGEIPFSEQYVSFQAQLAQILE
ncbi:ATP-binding protein [Candidatus Saccharibacteria bacterium]|nr:ATP-binding protein [Candidatus Saccharibacteria bacterium]